MNSEENKKYSFEAKKIQGSLLLITGSIGAEEINAKKKNALKRIGENFELPGFRKGKVPPDVIEKNVGALAIFEEAANIALEEAVPEILAEEKAAIIAMPSVTVTKLAPGNPLEFKITVPVMPEISLPDYKKISSKVPPPKKDSLELSEKEFEDTISNVKKTVAEWKRRKNNPAASQEDFHVHDENCNHEHDAEKEAPKGDQKKENEKAQILPDLTDEDVRMIGDYKDVADFNIKLRTSLKEDKERQAADRRRAAIADALLSQTKTDLPEVLIDDEVTVMLERLKYDVSRMGLEFEKYLEHIKKTQDDLKKEFRGDAVKRVTLQLTLRKIAEEEKISAQKEEVEKEIAKVMKQMDNPDESRVREKITELLTNEAVFKFLENQIK